MKYLIIYLEIEHMLNFLSQNEKGDFLDLMIAYAKDQAEPNIENKNVLNVFNFVKGRLDSQFEKAKIKAEVARKNGAAGGRPTPKKKPKRTQPKPNKTQWVIPNFIDTELWNGFLEMRKKQNATPTDFAIKSILGKLGAFESKKTGNANDALRNSLENNWKGVFEPKGQSNHSVKISKDDQRQQNNMDATMKFLNKYGVTNA